MMEALFFVAAILIGIWGLVGLVQRWDECTDGHLVPIRSGHTQEVRLLSAHGAGGIRGIKHTILSAASSASHEARCQASGFQRLLEGVKRDDPSVPYVADGIGQSVHE